MQGCVLTVLLGMTLFAVVNAAAFPGSDCPNNRRDGEVWYPEGCMKCFCHDGGYGCHGCGSASIGFHPDSTGCRLEEDKSAPYPKCCPSIVCD